MTTTTSRSRGLVASDDRDDSVRCTGPSRWLGELSVGLLTVPVMKPSPLPTTVAGEDRLLLQHTVQRLARQPLTPDRTGLCRVSVNTDESGGRAFIRALMRVEAELLLKDADSFDGDPEVLRSSAERSVAASALLIERVRGRSSTRECRG